MESRDLDHLVQNVESCLDEHRQQIHELKKADVSVLLKEYEESQAEVISKIEEKYASNERMYETKLRDLREIIEHRVGGSSK